jgi:hypothetical protein
MGEQRPTRNAFEKDGWTLISAEARQDAHPDTFQIPSREARETLTQGDGVKLLFDIETREGDRVTDRGVDRLWVIVKRRTGLNYLGVLDSDPGSAEGLNLHVGDVITFGPEHVAEIDRPLREYIEKKHGVTFFDE